MAPVVDSPSTADAGHYLLWDECVRSNALVEISSSSWNKKRSSPKANRTIRTCSFHHSQPRASSCLHPLSFRLSAVLRGSFEFTNRLLLDHRQTPLLWILRTRSTCTKDPTRFGVTSILIQVLPSLLSKYRTALIPITKMEFEFTPR